MVELGRFNVGRFILVNDVDVAVVKPVESDLVFVIIFAVCTSDLVDFLGLSSVKSMIASFVGFKKEADVDSGRYGFLDAGCGVGFLLEFVFVDCEGGGGGGFFLSTTMEVFNCAANRR
jgi:hypothetical protein